MSNLLTAYTPYASEIWEISDCLKAIQGLVDEERESLFSAAFFGYPINCDVPSMALLELLDDNLMPHETVMLVCELLDETLSDTAEYTEECERACLMLAS